MKDLKYWKGRCVTAYLAWQFAVKHDSPSADALKQAYRLDKRMCVIEERKLKIMSLSQ